MPIATKVADGLTVSPGPGTPQSAPLAGSPFDLASDDRYLLWRERKLTRYPLCAESLRVPIVNMMALTEAERAAIVAVCQRANMAIYTPECTSVDQPGGSSTAKSEISRDAARLGLRALATAFGLGSMETHRSADADGIVAIEVTDQASKRGFIPYSSKPLSWHTDGYYNGPEDVVRSMLLHCVRPASEGGENALLDPEIVYIRLRDESPALAAAMMHPEAMRIPASVDDEGKERPESVGPVFGFDPTVPGALAMRYTSRKRNISWRNDPDTTAARELIDNLLAGSAEPLIIRTRLAAGEGLISNNVLHARTSFAVAEAAAVAPKTCAGRLLYRARYSQRIAGT